MSFLDELVGRKNMLVRAIVCIGVALAILVGTLASEAQQSAKTHRIGLLIGSSERFVAPYIEIFRQALRALGYLTLNGK